MAYLIANAQATAPQTTATRGAHLGPLFSAANFPTLFLLPYSSMKADGLECFTAESTQYRSRGQALDLWTNFRIINSTLAPKRAAIWQPLDFARQADVNFIPFRLCTHLTYIVYFLGKSPAISNGHEP
jgi:hypothetical protein